MSKKPLLFSALPLLLAFSGLSGDLDYACLRPEYFDAVDAGWRHLVGQVWKK